MKKLYVIDGPMKGKSFALPDGITSIGRSSDNDICISQKEVSRYHAKFLKKDDKVLVVDLGSLQGVFVDGKKIKPGLGVEIKKDSKMGIGKIMLSFRDAETEPPDTSEPLQDISKNYIRSLELLLKVSNTLVQSLKIDTLLGEIIDQVFNLLKRIDRGAILLLDKDTGKLQEAVSKTRMDDKGGVFSKIGYSRTIVRRTIKDGKPVMMSDTHQADRTDLSDSMERMNVRSVMCVPLRHKGDIRGVIYVDSIGLPEGFGKDDLQVLTALSNTAAIAIENARLYEELKQELAETRRAEKALQEARRELEDRVKKRTGELSKTVDFLKQEIADHMAAEDALREREERYRTLVQNVPIAVYRTTPGPKGRFLMANPTFLKMFGLGSEKELSKITVADVYMNPEDRKAFSDDLSARGSVADVELPLRKKDGRPFWASVTARVVYDENGKTPCFDCTITDINERKRAEEEIKRSAAQLATLHQTGAAVSSRLSPDEIFKTVLRGLSEAFDYRLIGIYLLEDEMLELKARVGYSSPPDPALAHISLEKGVIGRTARTGQPQLVTDVAEDPDFFYGTPDIVSEVCVPLKRGDEVLGVLNVESDRADKPLDASDLQLVTVLSNYIGIAIENARLYDSAQQELAKHMKAEDALRKSEEIYHTVFQQSRDAIFITTREGTFVDVNPSFLDLFGYTRDGIADLKAQALYVNPDDRSRLQREIEREGFVRDFAVQLRHKDGEGMECLLTASVRRADDKSVQGYQGIIREITEHKRARQEKNKL